VKLKYYIPTFVNSYNHDWEFMYEEKVTLYRFFGIAIGKLKIGFDWWEDTTKETCKCNYCKEYREDES
jgi:hypothetical protein